MQATAEVTGGSIDNLRLISSGKPYIGFTMTDAAQDALKGEDKFKGNKVPLKTLAILYPNRMHIVTSKAPASPDDRSQGQARFDRSPGSATEVMSFADRSGRLIRRTPSPRSRCPANRSKRACPEIGHLGDAGAFDAHDMHAIG